MASLHDLFDGNNKFLTRIRSENPDLLPELAKGQKPEYLWIGCADSRVPPEIITDQNPGKIFVHRNIANLIHPSDMSVLSILYFSLHYLKIRKIIICGHTQCGGIQASILAYHKKKDYGFLENWLHPVKQLYREKQKELLPRADEPDPDTLPVISDKLSEMNVIEQMEILKSLSIVKEYLAQEKQEITLYGMIYNLEEGRLKLLREETLSP